ncbi:MAG TPA: hypothetical protein VH186_28745 [Chloroflexia bacterium]|nr:hypothetical protein [Chloroflexia bacterium]
MDFFLNDEPLGGGETIARLKEKISPFFEVLAEEVKGHHPGGRTLELDVIAHPKPELIKDGFADINVGFTLRNPLSGPAAGRDVPRKAKELIDLAHAKYDNYGGLPLILVYPGFFAHLRADQRQKLGDSVSLFERICGQFNVGELKVEGKNLVVMYNGARYWDSVFGVNAEREYHFTPLVF